MNTTPLSPDERDAIRAQGLCPDCGASLQRAGKRAWICPNQRTEGNRISAAVRESVKKTTEARVASAPF